MRLVRPRRAPTTELPACATHPVPKLHAAVEVRVVVNEARDLVRAARSRCRGESGRTAQVGCEAAARPPPGSAPPARTRLRCTHPHAIAISRLLLRRCPNVAPFWALMLSWVNDGMEYVPPGAGLGDLSGSGRGVRCPKVTRGGVRDLDSTSVDPHAAAAVSRRKRGGPLAEARGQRTPPRKTWPCRTRPGPGAPDTQCRCEFGAPT